MTEEEMWKALSNGTLSEGNAIRWLQDALASERQRTKEALYMRNLLAVVHGDGGHYTDKHGIRKATDDAIQIVNNRTKMRGELEFRIEAVEKERDQAIQSADARGRLLDEHRKSCMWKARAESAEESLAKAKVALEKIAALGDRSQTWKAQGIAHAALAPPKEGKPPSSGLEALGKEKE